MGNFTGQLNANEITASLSNMIISQQVFADNIAGTNSALVDRARTDGGLSGDTKLFYSTDALKSYAWGNDAEAANLLQLYRPDAPEQQAIELNIFRQIPITLDNYLSKRAWQNLDAFAQFTSVMKGWIGVTKQVHDSTTYNAFFGTCYSSAAKGTVNVTLSTITETGEEKNRLRGQKIAQAFANLMVDLKDTRRDYNDYGHLRSYAKESIKIVVNSLYANEITKLDLPTVYHADGLFTEDDILPARFFGTINTSDKVADAKTRSLIEQEITHNSKKKHYFAGDLIETGATAPAGTSYQEDAKVIAKVVVKLPPYMSAFEVSTSFFNPKSLTETTYLTYGYNTLEHLKGYPFITVKEN